MSDPFEEVAATWRPAPAVADGVVEESAAGRLAALLGVDPPVAGAPLPPLWREAQLRDAPALADLGPDGHPLGGALLPPLADRRRMFGGGTVEVVAPLRVGEHASRRSEVADVRVRDGRSGRLLLVTEEHTWSVGGEERIRERRDVVYRRAEDVGAGAAGPGGDRPEGWSTTPDERLLFAYSALTYNLHRIHYDAPYARDVEHHPALVVHGPLLALWCAERARTVLGRAPGALAYRLTATAYVGDEVVVTDAPDEDTGGLHLEAWSQGRCCARMDVRG
ncbi:hypothetical protein GCM10011519_22760 [Marmoricola endophyticus]|uniref:FAS1-like dehydratase domain-containing protein n=1 Tax=Marmoricola endophyticus TaxID=2040280 RepID=A0A917BKZ6_9ACTN|nr:MaoC family dehydratase N-terminal domain-containing protein [Marmoricola endophyticus]GGF48224.1 hypothetical protein GCM10011519_22760 [Marmoricola endophyticus]